MNTTEATISYYNHNTDKFIQETGNLQFSSVQEMFLQYVPDGGLILDLGCGSGRDSKVFLEKGYRIVAVDGSEKMCRAAREYIGHPVICSLFQTYQPAEKFDGIWACASLLHLQEKDIISVIRKMSDALKVNGVFYMSFKYGIGAEMRLGRYYTDFTEDTMQNMIRGISELSLIKMWFTQDIRTNNDTKWLNILCSKSYVVV